MEVCVREIVVHSGEERQEKQEVAFHNEALILIRDLAIALRLSQQVVATAQVYFSKVTYSFSSL